MIRKQHFRTMTDQWTRWDTWKERLGVFFEYAVGLPFIALVAIGMLWFTFSWVVDGVLPEKWSNTVKDVFTTADKKRAQADTLSEFAASLRMEADQELKELEHPTPEYDSETNDKYRNAERFEARAAELRRKANKHP